MAKYSNGDKLICIESCMGGFTKGNTYEITRLHTNSKGKTVYSLTMNNGERWWLSEYKLELCFKKNDYNNFDYAMGVI
jgi:hypothetical protein